MSQNYISLLLGLVPALAALVFVCTQVFRSPFAVVGEDGSLYQNLPIPFAEAYVCGALLLIGAVAAFMVLKKQKRAVMM